MKKIFIIFSASIILALFTACTDDSNESVPLPPSAIDKTPVFETITKDIIVEEYSTYADKWRTIFPYKSVINTNPDTIVVDSILAKMSEEANAKLEK